MSKIDKNNLAGVDLNLLVVLEALYAEQNVTKAGERGGFAQSSVSTALTRLRHLFNDALCLTQVTAGQIQDYRMGRMQPWLGERQTLGGTLHYEIVALRQVMETTSA